MRDVTSLNFDASLADLGLDSLMGVEIRQILERDFDVVMSMRDIRQLTISKLQEVTNNKSKGANGIVNTPAGILEVNAVGSVCLNTG